MQKILDISEKIYIDLKLRLILSIAGYIANAVLIRPLKWMLSAVGKILKTIFQNPVYSLTAFILFYLVIFSWQMAVALVASILIHESGHIVAMKKLKLKHGKIMFIPMVGAVIGLKDDYITSRKNEATMAIMGPLFGTILALAMTGMWLVMPNNVIILTAFISSILNLFNLVPIGDMDGGRVLRSVLMSLNEKIGIYACIALSLVLLCVIGIYLQWYVSLIIFFLAVAPMLILYLAVRPTGIEKLEKKEVVMFFSAYVTLALLLFVVLAYSSNIIMNSKEMMELIKFRF